MDLNFSLSLSFHLSFLQACKDTQVHHSEAQLPLSFCPKVNCLKMTGATVRFGP